MTMDDYRRLSKTSKGKPTLLFENKNLVLPKNEKNGIIIQNGSVYKGTGSIRDDTMQLALFC